MQINKPQELIIHHTGGTDAQPLADSSNFTVKQCDELHKKRFNFKSSLGWYVGYHYYIDKFGIVTQCRADTDEGAHTVGKNITSIGICLAGNFDATLPTTAQVDALKKLVNELAKKWKITKVSPHRTYANKTCYGARLSDEFGQKLLVNNNINDMLEGKKTYIGIAILAVTSLVQWAGLTDVITGEDISKNVELIATLIGAAVSIYGRYQATKE